MINNAFPMRRNEGAVAGFYHGQMDAALRPLTQQLWLSGKIQVSKLLHLHYFYSASILIRLLHLFK